LTTLYNLTEQYKILLDEGIDTETGQIYDLGAGEFNARLNEIEDIIKDKVINLGKVCKELIAKIEAISNEIDYQSRRKKAAENQLEWLKSYILRQMLEVKEDRFETATNAVIIRINPPSVAIISEPDIPAEYMRIPLPPPPTPDKKLILEHWKETSEVVPGAQIITDKKRIEIR